MTLVGAPEQPLPVAPSVFIFRAAPACRVEHRRHRETQEMLDFCAEHGITADIETDSD